MEEKEDLVWALLSDSPDEVAQAERKLLLYRREHAEEIISNEARRAASIRASAAAESLAGEPGPEREDVSGTAAAFASGTRAEPGQAAGVGALGGGGAAGAPLAAAGQGLGMRGGGGVGRLPEAVRAEGRVANGDIVHARGAGARRDARWEAMAAACGWTADIPKAQHAKAAFGTVLTY